jgi:hypothetical protein
MGDTVGASPGAGGAFVSRSTPWDICDLRYGPMAMY